MGMQTLFPRYGVLALAALTGLGAVACSGGSESGENVSRLQGIGEARGGSEDDMVFVMERLREGDAEERTSAAWALGQAGGPESVPLLLEAAGDDDDLFVRVNATRSLGRLGGPGVAEALAGFLAEGEKDVQIACLDVLAQRRYQEVYAAVGTVLSAGADGDLRSMAAHALAEMGHPDSLPHLVKAAGDPETDVRSNVAYAMGKLGEAAALPSLLPMLKDTEWEVRANAAQALGMIGDASARPALEKAEEDPNSQVRYQAVRALERLG